MHRLVLLVAIAMLWRDASSAPTSAQPPPPARFANPDVERYHMRRHFEDLELVERLFMANRVDEGATLAYLLVRETEDPGMQPWQPQTRMVVEAARAVTTAVSDDDGLRKLALVAAACANCHAHAQAVPVFAPAPRVPADDASQAARMARHVWATERLWEGLVGAADARWKTGLETLAATPAPYSVLSDAPAFAARLQQLAKTQLAARPTTLLDDRAVAYGEMLVTCAACHGLLHVVLP